MRPATELMLTTSAQPRPESSAAASKCGRAAWVVLIRPLRLRSIIRSHSSVGASLIGPSSIWPALLTTMSSRPSSSTVRSTAAIACPWSVTSDSIASAVWPSAPISLASFSRRSSRRAATATLAPWAASARAVASPMPLLAPVTNATVPSSEVIRSFLSSFCAPQLPHLTTSLSADSVASIVSSTIWGVIGVRKLAASCFVLAVALCLGAAPGGAASSFDDGSVTVVTPKFEWNFGNAGDNPEQVEGLKLREPSELLGPNIAASGGGYCDDPGEFWGQSYGNADGQGPGPVVAGSRGDWVQRGGRSLEINAASPEVCSGDTPPIPVRTRYTFFDTGAAASMVRVERRFSFAADQEDYTVQGVRAYVPRLPLGTYNQEIFPDAAGANLTTVGLCNVCVHKDDWNQTWVALNASGSNAGLLILRDPGNTSPASITLDYDSSSNSNNSGISLDRPAPASWKGPLSETEYLCFYDAASWPPAERSATRLPDGCATATPPINTATPAISAGAGSPRAGERFFAAAGSWDNAAGAFSYQWSRCVGAACQQIPGATATSYTAVATDVGKSLKVNVTATAPGGETDVAESNLAGTISGHVYEGVKDAANLVPLAQVQVCRRSGKPCRSTTTDAGGAYTVQAPLVGKFRVTAFPPGGSKAVAHTRATITRVRAEVDATGQDVVLGAAKTPPPQVEFSGSGVRGQSAEGIPVVHWQEPFVINYETGIDNEVEARVEFPDGQQLRVDPEQPVEPSPKDSENGIFRFSIQPLYPNDGAARVSIVVRGQRTEAQIEAEEAEIKEEEAEEEEAEEEEDEEEEEKEEEEEGDEEDEEEEEPGPGNPEEITFPIYIDPSGFVHTVSGAPLGGATVTLFRSDAKAGPFTVVPDGSAAMSPMNRRNSDLSEADGHFGWDVIAGFYKVRVEKGGCHAPAQPGQPAVETMVMTIPPPVTNLDLRLECEASAPPLVLKPSPSPLLRASLSLPSGAGTVKVDKAGRFKLKTASVGCPAASPGPCPVTIGVSATLPLPKGKGGKRGRAKPVQLGATTSTVAAGGTVTLEGKLSGAGLRQLPTLRRLQATLSVSARVPPGESSSGSLGASLLPPPKKAKPPRH